MLASILQYDMNQKAKSSSRKLVALAIQYSYEISPDEIKKSSSVVIIPLQKWYQQSTKTTVINKCQLFLLSPIIIISVYNCNLLLHHYRILGRLYLILYCIYNNECYIIVQYSINPQQQNSYFFVVVVRRCVVVCCWWWWWDVCCLLLC